MIPSAYYNLKNIDPASAGLLNIYLDKTAAVNFSGLMKNVGQRFNSMAGKANTFMQGAKQVGKGALQGAGYGGLGGAIIGGGLGFLDPGTQNGGAPGIMDRIRGGINGAVTGTGIGMGIGAGVGGYRSFGKGKKMPGLNTAAQNKSLPKTNNVPQLTYNQPNTINAEYSKVGSLMKEAANPGFSTFFNNAGKILRRSGQGALAGGIGGAALGFMDPETSTNPMTGQKTDPGIGGRIRSAIQGAGTGAALGGIGGAAYGFAGKGGKAAKGKKQKSPNTQQTVNQNAQQAAANQAAQDSANQAANQATQRNRQSNQNTRRQQNAQQQQQTVNQNAQQAVANAQAAQTQVPAQAQQQAISLGGSTYSLSNDFRNKLNQLKTMDNAANIDAFQQRLETLGQKGQLNNADMIELKRLANNAGINSTLFANVPDLDLGEKLDFLGRGTIKNIRDSVNAKMPFLNSFGNTSAGNRNAYYFSPYTNQSAFFGSPWFTQNGGPAQKVSLGSYNPFLKYAAHNFDVYDMGGKILADDVRTFIERQLPMYKNTTMDLLNKIKSLISGEVSYFKNKQLPDLKKFTNMLGEATGLKQPRNIQKPDVVKQLKTLASKPHSQPSTIKADVENVIEMVADKTGSYRSIEQQIDALVKTSSFWDNL